MPKLTHEEFRKRVIKHVEKQLGREVTSRELSKYHYWDQQFGKGRTTANFVIDDYFGSYGPSHTAEWILKLWGV